MTREELDTEAEYRREERLAILSQGGPVSFEMEMLANLEAMRYRMDHASEVREATALHGHVRS